MALALFNLAIPLAFIPHGHCYLWKPELVGLHLVSDALTALAYYFIPISLFYFVRKRQDLPFRWAFILFAIFIVACGTTHLMEIWTLWHPTYWLAGALKAITALVSVSMALLLLPLIPKALALPSPAQLEAANRALQSEIAERQRLEKERDGFFRLSPDLLCITTFDGYFQYVSPAWETETGFTTKELLASPYIDLIYADDRAALAADAQKVVAGIDTANYESRIQCKTGSVKWIAWSASAAPEEELIYVVGRNITERKQAELAVARLAAIVESSSDAIISKSLEGIITSWNASAEKLFGYTAAEAIGQSIAMLFPPDRVDELAQILEQIRRGEAIKSYETVRVRQDGQRIDTDVAISPIKDVTGRVIGAAKITRDITARKQTEEALKQSEVRNRALIQAMPDLLIRMKQDGTYLDIQKTENVPLINPTLMLPGNNLYDILPADEARKRMEYAQQALQTRALQVYEYQLKIDDKLQCEEARIVSCGEDEVLIIVRDITEQKQAEDNLRALSNRLTLALKSGAIGTWDWDITANRLTWDDHMYELYGITPDQSTNSYETWASGLHPDDRSLAEAATEQALAGEKDYEPEFRVVWPDGTIRYLAAHALVQRDADGQPLHMIGVNIDITERKQTEERLKLQSIILKNMTGGVCLVRTGDGGIAYTNPKFERMFGYDPGELDGKHVSIVNYQSDQVDANEVARTIMSTIQEQGEFTYAVHNVKKNGTPFWCQATASVLEHPEYGTVMVTVQYDISDRKHAEAERQTLMLKLQQSNQELEQFAFIASHDLKEPLRTIRSFCSLLQSKHRDSLNEKAQDYLNRIQNATQRMQALINDLLSLSQVSTQAKPFLPVDLAKIVQEVTSGLQKQLQQTGGRVEVENLPTVSGDSTQLSQLFQNLISNALKFHRDVAPVVKISSQLQPATGNANDSGFQQILVEDNGIGFEEKHCDSIFEAFERLHGRGDYEGTGIGLAICKKIVERHGGSISVRSTPGQGSTCIITLPNC